MKLFVHPKTLLATAFLLGFSLLLYQTILRPRKGDSLLIEDLLQTAKAARQAPLLSSKSALQERTQIRKDIWWGGLLRPHFWIESDYSELQISQQGHHFLAIESLETVQGALQEALYPEKNTQDVRTFAAKTAFYEYPSHRFFAPTLELSLYHLPGQELPSTYDTPPLLQAIAEEATFCVESTAPTLRAKSLTALIDTKKEIP